MSRLEPNAIRLWQRATPAAQRVYPVLAGERISRTQNAGWDRRVVTGPVSADAEAFLSSWTQDDYSGGFGILDANETSDTSRIAFGVIDGRRPKSMCLPPLTTEPAPPWTPLQLGATTLRAWYRGGAIGVADTAAVASWSDASGNANTLAQATGGVQPTFDETDAAVNNLPSVDFASASSQRLEIAGDFGLGSTPFSVYAVWFMANSNGQTLLQIEAGANDVSVDIDGAGALRALAGGSSLTAAITKAAWRMTGTVFNGASSALAIDGGTRATGTTGSATPDNTKATVGSDLAETGAFLNGSVAELLVIDGAVSQANEDRIFGYFAHKYGLAGSLPGGHTYKSAWPTATTTPSGLGAFRPLGDVGTQFYGGWDDLGVLGWNNASGVWYAKLNAWPPGVSGAVNRCVNFGGYLFCPVSEVGDDEGLTILSESAASTGTLAVAEVAIHAVAVGTHDNKLWAIDTANELWQLTVAGATAGPATIGNWTQVRTAFGVDLALDTGLTPRALVDWINPGQEEALWCVTRAQGAYILNPDEPRWVRQKIKPGAHPDWGLCATVFRDGEDLFIAAGGLDLTRETAASVEVPISGPSKDQGVPPEYRGSIVDLASERSTLYALIAAGTSVAAGSPTSQWVLQQTVGAQGSANGQFNNPKQVAVDGSGNVYVADAGNNRVQKFTSAGVYSSAITGLSNPQGVAVDSSGNVYVADNTTRLRKYDSAFALQWSQTFGSGTAHVATDGTHVFAADAVGNAVYKRLCSDGSAVSNWGSGGTGNGQFSSPTGVAVDGTHVYVVDRGNHRVQKFLKSDGSYVAQWGGSGSGNDNFSNPFGVATDDSGDLWVCDYGNARLKRTSNTGTYQTKIAQTSPIGIGVATGDILWVSTGTHTLAQWDEETVSTPAVAGTCWLGAWTGTAWCALWETTASIVPTWMHVSMKAPYALWWGDESGQAYYQLIPPPFFNPAARVTLGEYPFAATGWMETVRYDANMSGWDKIASHFFAMLDYAAADVYVDVSYRTDADQFDSGLLDPPWRPWKRIDHIGRTLCWFDDTDTDPVSGLPYHEGEPFQWIQFRYEFRRGADTFKTPIWMWHSLHHLSVPQDSSTIVLKIPLKDGKTFNREPEEIATTLRGFQTSRAMVHLQTQNPRPGNADWQVFYRGRITQVKSEFYAGANNKLDEVLVCTFVEMGASDNRWTTIATDTPA